MTENGKARELIATSETTVKVDPQNGWYLKRFAALQFEGSVDNFGTNMPIHVLEQQLPKGEHPWQHGSQTSLADKSIANLKGELS